MYFYIFQADCLTSLSFLWELTNFSSGKFITSHYNWSSVIVLFLILSVLHINLKATGVGIQVWEPQRRSLQARLRSSQDDHHLSQVRTTAFAFPHDFCLFSGLCHMGWILMVWMSSTVLHQKEEGRLLQTHHENSYTVHISIHQELYKQIISIGCHREIRQKLLLKHSQMHDVTTQANVALRVLSQKQRSSHILVQSCQIFIHVSVILCHHKNMRLCPCEPHVTQKNLCHESTRSPIFPYS